MRKKWISGIAILAALTISMTACSNFGEDNSTATAEQQLQQSQQEQDQQGHQSQAQQGQQSQDQQSQQEQDQQGHQSQVQQGQQSQDQQSQQSQDQQGQQSQAQQGQQNEDQQGQQATEETQETAATSKEAPRDLLKEEDSIREQGTLMLQNLELEEYLDEAINLISTDEWFATMMQETPEVAKSYYMKRGDEIILEILVWYREAGEISAKVCYYGEQVKTLQRLGNIVQLSTIQPTAGETLGVYENWICDGNTGDIYFEKSHLKDGVMTGDYTMSVHEGKAASEIYSLWNNREGMKYITYIGNFDEQGRTTLKQPSKEEMQLLLQDTNDSNCVVYAYEESGDKCLFQEISKGTDPKSCVFQINLYETNWSGEELFGWKVLTDEPSSEITSDPSNDSQPNEETPSETLPKEEEDTTEWTPDIL